MDALIGGYMWNEAFTVTGSSVLTDELFSMYGGDTGTATSFQRQVAFNIAEQQVAIYLNTFLTPTTVTGTWLSGFNGAIQLPLRQVSAINGLVETFEGIQREVDIQGRALVIDGPAGIISLDYLFGLPVEKYRIAFTAGFNHGVFLSTPMAMLGLVTVADLVLQQMTNPSLAEGGPGDPQLNSFSDSGYSESRGGLLMTAFGGSPRANYAWRMLNSLKYKRVMKL